MPRITPNLCLVDRCIRFVLGLACLYYGFFDVAFISNRVLASLIGVFGAVNLFAAAASYCPIYTLCGVSSVKQVPVNDGREHQG